MMRPLKNRYCNRSLAKPADWDVKRDGTCNTLPCCADGGSFHSWWLPNPAEVESIRAGRPIMLTVFGGSHPPVAVSVDTDNDDAGIEVP